MLKSKLFRIIISGLIVTLGLWKTNILSNILNRNSTAQAVGDLTINWGVPSGQPIFMVDNFLPGETEEKEITIINNSAIVQTVGVRGIKTTEIGDLPTVLDFVISTNGTVLYGGSLGAKTLAQFFNESQNPDGLFLFNLNPSESKKVKFSVKFLESASNEFQGTSVVFDLVIGVSSQIPEQCQYLRFDKIIFGTSRRDILHGTNGNDLIFGYEGNDSIDGSNGRDCLVGGSGNDRLNGSNGNDIILGEAGNDVIDASNGDDRIFGGGGNDRIDAGNGNDYVEGNEGNDNLRGGNGNDILLGGLGNDTARGDLGSDRCEAEVRLTCEF